MNNPHSEVIKLHKKGLQSLATHEGRLPYGQVKHLAQAADLDEEWFRKARQLAAKFPDRTTLESLLAICKRQKYPFTRAHLLVMLPVSAARWRALLTRAAKEKWSLAKLQSMILRKQGAKNLKGGRYRTPPETIEDAYMELQRFQRGWKGLLRSLKQEDKDEFRPDLHDDIRSQLNTLDKGMAKLSQQCTGVLNGPRKKTRKRSR